MHRVCADAKINGDVGVLNCMYSREKNCNALEFGDPSSVQTFNISTMGGNSDVLAIRVPAVLSGSRLQIQKSCCTGLLHKLWLQ